MRHDQSLAIRHTIQALADDYESIETIEKYYADQSPKFTQSEIKQALLTLLAEGCVQPYLYSESTMEFIPSDFSPDAAESFWFGLTSKGRASLKDPP